MSEGVVYFCPTLLSVGILASHCYKLLTSTHVASREYLVPIPGTFNTAYCTTRNSFMVIDSPISANSIKHRWCRLWSWPTQSSGKITEDNIRELLQKSLVHRVYQKDSSGCAYSTIMILLWLGCLWPPSWCGGVAEDMNGRSFTDCHWASGELRQVFLLLQ